MAMPDLANPVSPSVQEAGASPAVAPSAGAESIPNELMDYVTPPPKNVLVVTVRYGEAKKRTPMPYDLAASDEEQ
jgi:hypothetical protein